MVAPNLTGDCGITSSEEGLYEIVMSRYNESEKKRRAQETTICLNMSTGIV